MHEIIRKYIGYHRTKKFLSKMQNNNSIVSFLTNAKIEACFYFRIQRHTSCINPRFQLPVSLPEVGTRSLPSETEEPGRAEPRNQK